MCVFVSSTTKHKWAIISPARSSRPDNFSVNQEFKQKMCPFCPGNENLEEEVLRYGSAINKSDWQLRVVKNKYPITNFHEVVIHSPEETELDDLPVLHVELIIKAYTERFNALKDKGNVIIFCNQGEHAGASLKHPHSQIAVIPTDKRLEILERESPENIVEKNDYFSMYCPSFSQWPYEIWIAPKVDQGVFGDINNIQIQNLAILLQNAIRKLKTVYENRSFLMLPFAYNFYIYPQENWYVRIIPRFIHKGGLELATGIDVNIKDPLKASIELQEHKNVGMILEKLLEKSN